MDLSKEYYDKKEYIKSLEVMIPWHNSSNDESLRDALKINMAKCFYHKQRADLAEELLYKLKFPMTDQVLVDLALYKNALGKFEEAYEILVKLPKSNLEAQFNLGWHYLRHGKFNQGMRYLNSGRDLKVYGGLHFHKHDMRKLYNGEKCNKLAVLMEGGYGDELIFARWLPYISTLCNEMTVYSYKSLVPLLKKFGFNALPAREFFDNAEYDKFIPSMAIPVLLNLNGPLEKCSMPYIPCPSQIKHDKLRIGIKYRGNPMFEHDQFREMDLNIFEGLTKYGEVYDLQLDNILIEEGIKIGKQINNWVDTYNIISNLDVIITSCTAIAHLSAAMGKKTIIIIPLVPYFIWCGKNWYKDNVKVIQQKVYGSWSNVKEQVHRELEKNAL